MNKIVVNSIDGKLTKYKEKGIQVAQADFNDIESLSQVFENVDHSYTEVIIQNSPLDYIILRNSLFVEAFTSDYMRVVKAHEDTNEKNMGRAECGLSHVKTVRWQVDSFIARF